MTSMGHTLNLRWHRGHIALFIHCGTPLHGQNTTARPGAERRVLPVSPALPFSTMARAPQGRRALQALRRMCGAHAHIARPGAEWRVLPVSPALPFSTMARAPQGRRALQALRRMCGAHAHIARPGAERRVLPVSPALPFSTMASGWLLSAAPQTAAVSWVECGKVLLTWSALTNQRGVFISRLTQGDRADCLLHALEGLRLPRKCGTATLCPTIFPSVMGLPCLTDRPVDSPWNPALDSRPGVSAF